jgi:hypothetical protein
MVQSTRRGKFIDIEVFGGISVGGSFKGMDILSDNWDGSNPANLASVDAGATVGYYLDGSAGAAQFMGNLYVGGDIELSSTGVFKSAPTGTARVEIKQEAAGHIRLIDSSDNTEGILFLTTHTDLGDSVLLGAENNDHLLLATNNMMYFVATAANQGFHFFAAKETTFNGTNLATPDPDLKIFVGGPIRTFRDFTPDGDGDIDLGTSALKFQNLFVDEVRAGDGLVTAPAYDFDSDSGNGMYLAGTNQVGIANDGKQVALFGTPGTTQDVEFGSGGTGKSHIANFVGASFPVYSFQGDVTMGMYRVSAGEIGFATAGTLRVRISNVLNLYNLPGHASAPFMRIDNTTKQIYQDTSLRAQKSFIKPLDPSLADLIDVIQLVEFRMKGAPRGTLPTWGEIAEDVVEAMPMVQHSYDENGDLGIHSRDSLAALGLLAIQDLRRRVKVLETA